MTSYVRMVGETVAEVKIECSVDAHLSHDYVLGERLPCNNMQEAHSVEDEAAIEAELYDRYGVSPEPV